MNNTEAIKMNIGGSKKIDIEVKETDNMSFTIENNASNSNYNKLFNKPQINSVELIGNKNSSDLNLQPAGNYANTRITNIEIDNLFR